MAQNIEQLSTIGKKLTNSALLEFQDRNAIRQVLGCLLNNPQLIKMYPLELYDFVDVFHQIIFSVIKNLAREGAEEIELDDIIVYLEAKYPTKYQKFIKLDGERYVLDAKELAHPKTFKANYEEIRKWAALRAIAQHGIDVSEFFDPNETDPQIIEETSDRFNSYDTAGIIAYFKQKIIAVNEMFISHGSRNSIKAGGLEAHEQKEAWKESIDHGLAYASNYLTTITYGIRKKKFTVMSAGTGVGKTRITVSNICHTFAPKFYDKESGEWKDNPNGTKNCCLYIGTEMELREEVEPIIWGYMADVPENHILMNTYEEGEEERVDQAIAYLTDTHDNAKRGIYLEYIPDYDIATLEHVIEQHVTLHGVTAVFLDYIHTTSALLNEYQRNASSKMAIREDQVLGNLSAKLKDLTRKFDISIDTWTQVSGDFKNIQNRDQTIVRGSRAIIDKADVAAIVSRPTEQEYKKMDKILKSPVMAGKKKPNVCMAVYKNRGGQYNQVKIWLYIDYATMRVHDMYTTDYDYAILPIKKSTVCVTEDGRISVSTYDDSYKSYLASLNKEEKEELKQKEEQKLLLAKNSTLGSDLIDEVDKQIASGIVDDEDDDFDY